VSSFSIHVSKLYKQTKWPVLLKIISSLRFVQRSHFSCRRSESEQDSFQVSECLEPECFQLKESVSVVQQT
jgi:hypothetical protein